MADVKHVAKGYQQGLRGQALNPSRNQRLSELAKIMHEYEIPGAYRKYKDPRGDAAAVEYDRVMQERGDDKGYLYQAHINANPDHFIDWDKPLSEQSEVARAALNKVSGQDLPLDMNGQNAWERAWTNSGDDYKSAGLNASKALREAGIPGIRYLDGASRGTGEGSSNYVLFDDDLIDILHKWHGDEQLYSNGSMAAAPLAGDPHRRKPINAPFWPHD